MLEGAGRAPCVHPLFPAPPLLPHAPATPPLDIPPGMSSSPMGDPPTRQRRLTGRLWVTLPGFRSGLGHLSVGPRGASPPSDSQRSPWHEGSSRGAARGRAGPLRSGAASPSAPRGSAAPRAQSARAAPALPAALRAPPCSAAPRAPGALAPHPGGPSRPAVLLRRPAVPKRPRPAGKLRPGRRRGGRRPGSPSYLRSAAARGDGDAGCGR